MRAAHSATFALLFLGLQRSSADQSKPHPPGSGTGEGNICRFDDPQQPLTLEVAPNKPVSFQCETGESVNLSPSEPPYKNVYLSKTCSGKGTELESLCSGAELSPGSLNPKENTVKNHYTLTLTDAGCKTDKMYYCCEKRTASPVEKNQLRESQAAQAGQTCIVEITVKKTELPPPGPPPPVPPAAAPGLPNSGGSQDQDTDASNPETQSPESIEMTTCNSTTKNASVSIDRPLSFKWGAGLALEPDDTEKAWDGECGKQVVLMEVVETAELEEKQTTVTETEYRLTVKDAPAQDTAVCYKCVSRAFDGSLSDPLRGIKEGELLKSQCLLKVSVKGLPTSSARGSSAPSSVAGGVLFGILALCI
ncbi:hypothetical protein BESB_034090 [Besnoitia besnoiti]|uniref:SAG-related sequence n=1 Tax=Besnoitia besnoiti TaxID=94643 RepID=A0A2A9MKX5_BESBE|nr:hypothetical protein BESB_034090 [Besnoitia besnoiti]PFH36951.1 hypothetical protein BESB_034090 [Besnoitia besnoiti]